MSKVYFSTTLIASSDPALLRMGPSGMSVNGSPIVQVEQLFKADRATVYGRGDGPVEISFSVDVKFFTEAQVAAFIGTHRESLPVQSELVLTDDLETASLVMADAVRAVNFPRILGTSVTVEYKFTGSRFTSEDVPTFPTDTDYVKAINQALTNGAVEQAIAFDAAFVSAPRGISLQLSAPDGGAMFGWQIRESTRTAAGFTVDFDAAVPAVGYKLTGIAVL